MRRNSHLCLLAAAVAFLLLFTFTTANASIIIPDGSVQALYHFNNDFSDSSGNQRNLTNNIGVDFQAGILGSAAHLANYPSGLYTSSNGLGPTAASVSVWLKLLSPPANYFVMIGNAQGDPVFQEYNIDYDGQTLYWCTRNFPAGCVTKSATLETNRWYMLALRYDGSVIEGFLDGQSVGSKVVGPNVGGTRLNNFINLGFNVNCDCQFLTDALLDEAVFVNRPFTDQEISSLWNGGHGQEVCVTPGCDAKEPVVIVPGIMGSRLNRVFLDQKEVWPNVNEMLSTQALVDGDAYLNELKLNSDGSQTSNQIMPVDVLRQATGSFAGIEFNRPFYQNIIDKFIQDGYIENQNLFVAPYDWRLSIGSSTDRLASKILQAVSASPTGKVNIVAHSMGGLLAKEYLAGLSDTSFVDKLILVGVPQLGAPKALKVRNYGDNFGIGILNPNRIKEISANMSSIYQLLPSRRYINIAGSYVKDFRNGATALDYDSTKQFSLQNATDTNSSLWDLADAFHQNRDTTPFNVSNTYNIAGCQDPATIGEFRLYPNGKVDITAVDGDGTVPTISAENLGSTFAKNYFVLNSQVGSSEDLHLDLVRAAQPLALIKNIIDGQPDNLPQGISQASADCFAQLPNSTKVIFSIHSPADLHIYDSQSRHTGPTASGDVEFGIPGSNYFTIGENKFASVPAGNTYKVEAQALSSGSFDLKAKIFNGASLENTITYLSVPLQSASTTAELDFSGISGDLGLKLDNNGDGVVDQTINPNATLIGNQASDITPPAITISSPTGDVLINSTTTISFSATDDISGVAILRATLDGASVNNGTIVTLSLPGAHVLHVESVDNAGNLAVKDFIFNAIYGFGGFLPPVKADGTGIYNQGRTLPIKFQLKDANNNFISNAAAHLFLAKVSGDIVGTEEVALSTSAADSGNLFRYDSISNQYIFNLSLNLDIGNWRLRVELDDVKSYTVDISVKQ